MISSELFNDLCVAIADILNQVFLLPFALAGITFDFRDICTQLFGGL